MKKRKRLRKVTTSSNTKPYEPVLKTEIKAEFIEESKPQLTHDQLLKALYWVFDLFDRALINFFLVGKTAECVVFKKQLEGDCIEVGVRHNEWKSGSLRIIEAFALADKVDKKYALYTYNNIPIIVHILEDHPTITSPDMVLYQSEYFRIPNPYKEFLEVKNTL
jgi:hypothetical protein